MPVRFVCACLALAACAATADGQSWTTHVGIQGGWSRVQQTGVAGDPLFSLTFPGLSLGSSLPAPGAVFVIAPISDRLAVEPGFSAAQLGLLGSSATLGVRLDYSMGRGLYAALGGVLAYRQANGATDVQPGIQAALGFRRHVSGTLHGRVEVNWQTIARSDRFTAKNAYSVLLGLTAPVARGERTVAPPGAWRATIGVQGGYASYHIAGLGGFTFLSVPGLGGAMYLGTSLPIVLPPTVFLTVPVGRRMAIEAGLDVNRVQRSDSTQLAATTTIRVNYAFDSRWYAAGGAALHTLTQTGERATSVPGLYVAGGYRFPFAGALGARVEMSYTVMRRNERFGIASQTFAIMMGVTIPLR